MCVCICMCVLWGWLGIDVVCVNKLGPICLLLIVMVSGVSKLYGLIGWLNG